MTQGASSYWSHLCRIRADFRCWVRVGQTDGSVSGWGQLLTLPTAGYLEASYLGPVPIEDIAWVELSTKIPNGGRLGRPLTLKDVPAELFVRLGETPLVWDRRQAVLSIEAIDLDRTVEVVRVAKPTPGIVKLIH